MLSIPSCAPVGSHAHLTEIRDTAFASGAASSFAALSQMPSQPVISKDHDLENHQPTYNPLSHSPLKRSSPRAVACPRPQDGMASHYVPASLEPPSHRICSSLAAPYLVQGNRTLLSNLPAPREEHQSPPLHALMPSQGSLEMNRGTQVFQILRSLFWLSLHGCHMLVHHGCTTRGHLSVKQSSPQDMGRAATPMISR